VNRISKFIFGPAPRWLFAAALGSIPPGPAQAVNGYSFLDAAQSRTRYSLAPAAPVEECATLARQSFAGMTISSAQPIAANAAAPAYCKVRGVIPGEIQVEVRLPQAWNRRLYMVGNGGYGGQSLDTYYATPRDDAIRHGFATVMTNTGHDAAIEPDATFAYRNEGKKNDWAHRAVHVTVVAAKRLVATYYGRAQSFAYFDGCSNGGRQGLISAQRYPGDFDGIVAGAPLLDFTGSSLSYLWTARALNRTPIPHAKMPMIAAAIMRRCDAADGLKDDLIADPRRCDFNPARDLPQCSAQASAGATCLTPGEVATLKAIYAGPSWNGQPLYHPVLAGAEPRGVIYLPPHNVESGWFEWTADPRGPMYVQAKLGEQFLKYFAYPVQDPAVTAAALDFDRDPPRMTAARALVDALDPDLSAYRKRGGKLLLYHGWADLGTNPLATVDYYERVEVASGGASATRDFARLFAMPGVFHCFGGYGPDRLDPMTALIDWVELGVAPDAIVAAKTERRDGGRLLRRRPICAYPAVAAYNGRGSIDAAENFTCKTPAKG
jgi:hypothetical protein